MPLSQKQLKDVCLLGHGYKQCRFVAQDALDYSKFHCLKKTGQAKQINEDIEETLESLAQRKLDYKKQGLPVGTGRSCKGYPVLKVVEQGYDLDKP
jgi:hypothetical protein